MGGWSVFPPWLHVKYILLKNSTEETILISQQQETHLLDLHKASITYVRLPCTTCFMIY
jgi:hypothetical protein